MGTMKWFGKSWDAPVCDPHDHIATPVDSLCAQCTKPIEPDDQGFVTPFLDENNLTGFIAWHLDCFLKNIGVGTAR